MFARSTLASVALAALALVSSTSASAISRSLVPRDATPTIGSHLPPPDYDGLNKTNQNFCNNDENAAPPFVVIFDFLNYYNQDGNKVAGSEGAPKTCVVIFILNGGRLSLCNPTTDKNLISPDDVRVSLKKAVEYCLKPPYNVKFFGGAFKIYHVNAQKQIEDPEREDYLMIDKESMIPPNGTAEAAAKKADGQAADDEPKSQFEQAATNDDSKSAADREAEFDKGGN